MRAAVDFANTGTTTGTAFDLPFLELVSQGRIKILFTRSVVGKRATVGADLYQALRAFNIGLCICQWLCLRFSCLGISGVHNLLFDLDKSFPRWLLAQPRWDDSRTCRYWTIQFLRCHPLLKLCFVHRHIQSVRHGPFIQGNDRLLISSTVIIFFTADDGIMLQHLGGILDSLLQASKNQDLMQAAQYCDELHWGHLNGKFEGVTSK